MAAGTAVNLVSRCSSVDEFVAAFRTYVHRDHVFVPTSGQVSAGTRGTIAITLADGTPVLWGEAEVLSSSQVPQGPYQKPGLRLRFVDVDAAAKPVLARLERARTEPGLQLADAIGAPTTGARTDIRAADGPGGDPAEAAMCTVVETAAPTPARVDLTPKPAPRSLPKIPGLGGLGGVPGKSFKIPSIPGPPRPAAAVPVAETSGPVSGDFTVPTDPPFGEPSRPFPAASVAPPPAAAPSSPGGKSRNRTMLGNVRGRPPATESAPHAIEGATIRMPPLFPEGEEPASQEPVSETGPVPAPIAEAVTRPAPDPAPEPIAEAPAPAKPGLGAPPAGRTFARTLLGVPAISLTPAAPATPPLSADEGWGAPEEGGGHDRTERSETPAPVPESQDQDVDVDDLATDLDTAALPPAEVEMVLPPEPPPSQPMPVMPPVIPEGVVAGKGASLRAGPSAPTMRTPQSLLELGHVKAQTPLPGMRALPGLPPPLHPTPPPPPPVPSAAVVVARQAEPTELVFRHDGTDQIHLGTRRRRPLIIGIAAGVVLLGVVLGLVIAGSGDGEKKQPAATTPAAADAATVAVAPPDAAAAAANTTPPEEIEPDEIEPEEVEPEEIEPEEVEPEEVEPEEPVAAVAEPKPGGCPVTFTSKPAGASITVGGDRIGKTPATVDLPCKKASATFTRPRYQKTVKAFTPKQGAATKVAVRLDRPTFTIRVTSSPSGATVVVGSKKVGKTPVTAKVPGYQAVSVKVSKPGFQTRTTKVSAKKNNTSVKVTLRRGN